MKASPVRQLDVVVVRRLLGMKRVTTADPLSAKHFNKQTIIPVPTLQAPSR